MMIWMFLFKIVYSDLQSLLILLIAAVLFLNDTTLGWFPGSDDIANLTFDVYLSFIYNDVATNNSAALIADDITNYTHSVIGLTESKKYYWKVVYNRSFGFCHFQNNEFYSQRHDCTSYRNY